MKSSHVLVLVGGILLLLVAGFFAVVAFVCSATQSAVEHVAATAGTAPLASAGNGPPPTQAPPPPIVGTAPTATSRTLGQLEARLRDGHVHAEGPGADVLAAELRSVLDADFGDAMVIHVAPGQPERVVVILRLSDLRDQGSLDRRKWLDDVGETLEWGFGADGLMVVAVRGRFAYGGLAVHTPGREGWQYDIGAVVSTAPLEAALATPAASAADPRQIDHYAFLEGTSRARSDAFTVTLEAGAPVMAAAMAPWGEPSLRIVDPSGAPVDLALGEGLFETSEEAIFVPHVTGAYVFRARTDASEGHLPYALRVRPPPANLEAFLDDEGDELDVHDEEAR